MKPCRQGMERKEEYRWWKSNIEKLSDTSSESLYMLTSLSRLIHVCNNLLLGLSFQHLPDINYLSYRFPNNCLTATHSLPSMDVSYSFKISPLGLVSTTSWINGFMVLLFIMKLVLFILILLTLVTWLGIMWYLYWQYPSLLLHTTHGLPNL